MAKKKAAKKISKYDRRPVILRFSEGYHGPSEKYVSLPDGRRVMLGHGPTARGMAEVACAMSPEEDRQYRKAGFDVIENPNPKPEAPKDDLSQPQTKD